MSKSQKKTPYQEEKKQEFCAYIGPTIVGVIQNGTVYKEGKAETERKLSGVIKKYPDVRVLIVKGDELPEARKKLSEPGNIIYVSARRLARGLRR